MHPGLGIITVSSGDKHDQSLQAKASNRRIDPASDVALEINQRVIGESILSGGANVLSLPTYRVGFAQRGDQIFAVQFSTHEQFQRILQHSGETLVPILNSAHPETNAVLVALHGVDINPYSAQDIMRDPDVIRTYHLSILHDLMSAGYTGEYTLHYETIPSVQEARIITECMHELGLNWSYTISFTTDAEGNLIDGNSIPHAIESIDRTSHDTNSQRPWGYLANCFSPNALPHLAQAIGENERFRGWYPNTVHDTSDLDTIPGAQARPTDIDESHIGILHGLPRNGTEVLGKGVRTIVGACCGSDTALLKRLRQKPIVT